MRRAKFAAVAAVYRTDGSGGRKAHLNCDLNKVGPVTIQMGGVAVKPQRNGTMSVEKLILKPPTNNAA